jgi:hypothetical protein
MILNPSGMHDIWRCFLVTSSSVGGLDERDDHCQLIAEFYEVPYLETTFRA